MDLHHNIDPIRAARWLRSCFGLNAADPRATATRLGYELVAREFLHRDIRITLHENAGLVVIQVRQGLEPQTLRHTMARGLGYALLRVDDRPIVERDHGSPTLASFNADLFAHTLLAA